MRKKIVTASYLAPAAKSLVIGSLLLGQSFVAQPARAQIVDPLAWLLPTLNSALLAPLPASVSQPNIGPVFPQNSTNPNATGYTGTYLPNGAIFTSSNAFFQSLGSNGRTCATCHSPESAMSLSLNTIRQRFNTYGANDALFAPVDGATCPKNVSLIGNLLGGLLGAPSPYAALLNKGLFRIFLPVPKGAEFTITVVSDPYGCNTTAPYNQVTNSDGSHQQIVSVYRRPIMSANLKFKVTTAVNSGILPPIDLVDGSPLPLYTPPPGAPFGPGGNGTAENSNIENGNIMSDGREPTLSSQAIDATMIHAQTKHQLTTAQLQQILDFEANVYAAQSSDNAAGNLSQNGGTGGPVTLAALPTGTITFGGAPGMTLYTAYKPVGSVNNAQRASIYRGEDLFNNRAFTVSNVSGFNNALGSNAVSANCSTCHGQTNVSADPTAKAQHDIGIGGDTPTFGGPKPATDLPIFKLTCTGSTSTVYNGTVVVTNDPGRALITGKCADIGRFTVQPLRGLAARAPYFTDGSAPTLSSAINFYDQRFAIGLSATDKQDLVNFLNSL